jgi:hypothetical protein
MLPASMAGMMAPGYPYAGGMPPNPAYAPYPYQQPYGQPVYGQPGYAAPSYTYPMPAEAQPVAYGTPVYVQPAYSEAPPPYGGSPGGKA